MGIIGAKPFRVEKSNASKLYLISVLLCAVFLSSTCTGGGSNNSTPPVASAPSGVTASAGDGQATISWAETTGTTSYNVYYLATAGVTIANGTRVSSATSGLVISNLTNGIKYYFVVTSVNAGVESVVSAEVSATPLAPPPGVPTGVTATAVNGQATVKWTAVTGATSYNLYYRTVAGVTIANGTKVSGATSGVVISNLTNGTKYYFVVTSVSAAGESSVSAEVSATPGLVATTLAGLAGVIGFTDGGKTEALFSQPRGITTDGVNLYVADMDNNTIRQVVIATGATTTLAGSHNSIGSDNGIAVNAKFSQPNGITTDGTNLYVTDTYNNTIRQIVKSSGQVTTIAGSAGLMGYTDGIGTLARFALPTGVTTDGTNIYVADAQNSTIRKIVISSHDVTTFAGSGGTQGSSDGTRLSARFYLPSGITTDGTNLYVADTFNHTIRQIVIATGAVTTIAGSAGLSGSTDGTGSAARFNLPSSLTTDGTSLYVADTYNHTIRQIVIATGVVTTIAGSTGVKGSSDGTGSAALFFWPYGITTYGTTLYVADSFNDTIRSIR
jgi:sugar lactone lactonase YvrE